MNKAHILKSLQQAKPDHIELIKQAHKLLDGTPQEKLLKPIQCKDCAFGKWYYEEGYKLVNIPMLKSLEELHRIIHQHYTALYYITFDRRKKARSTLIVDDIEMPVEEKAFRKDKLKQLEKKTVTMIRHLNLIEKKVVEMQDQDFENGWLT